jgi:hypothetical protein
MIDHPQRRQKHGDRPSAEDVAKLFEDEPAEQLHVIPPPRGTGSQHEAGVSVLTDERIAELFEQAFSYQLVDGDYPGMRAFVRAIEAELASRGRAPTTQAEGKCE